MADPDSGAPKAGLRNQARSLFEEASARVARFEPPAPAELAAAARASAARAARFELPARGDRLQRFGYGLALPFALARATLKDPAARRRYLRVIGVQLALTLGFGVFISLSSSEITDEFFQYSSSTHFETAAAVGLLSALYATISGVEWVVIALSRDFHDGVSRDASLLTGLTPEEDDRKPRVRIDLKWMWKRLRDKARGAFVFAAALPLLWLIATIAVIGPYLSAALLTLWSIYWSGVFAASRTVHGWKDEDRAPDPIFLRSWDRLTGRFPSTLRWAPKTYGRLVRRTTRSLFAPASRLEARPWELTGLSLARTLRHVPGFYLALRPFFSVAAAHVIVAHDRAMEAEAREVEAQVAALEGEAAARSRIVDPGQDDAAAAIAEADGESHEPEAALLRERAR
ncbi:MAG: hypothetical protein ACMG6S_22040 [Byssovorax sp.]